MIKFSMKLTPREVEAAFNKLSPKQRIKVLERLEDELFPVRLREILSVIRSKAKKTSCKDIIKICKEARRNCFNGEKD